MNTGKLFRMRLGKRLNIEELFAMRHFDGDIAPAHSSRFWIDDIELVWIKLGEGKEVLIVENDHWEQREYCVENGVIRRTKKTEHCFRYYLEDVERLITTGKFFAINGLWFY